MTVNPNSLANLNRKGRLPSNKIRFSDVITDERTRQVIEELFNIALNDAYAKNRLTAIQMILDRNLGKVALEINQTINDNSTLADLLNDSPQDTTNVDTSDTSVEE